MKTKQFIAFLCIGTALLLVISWLLPSLQKKQPERADETSVSPPSIVILPHHNIVKDIRLSFLESIAQKRSTTQTVILLSPDHFSPTQKDIYCSRRTWNLSTGILKYDAAIGQSLEHFCRFDERMVQNDHGIYNVLPDIREAFGKVSIVPILLGQHISLSELDPFVTAIHALCTDNCLLIASVDFSHYLPYTLADVHDEETIYALQSLILKDPEQIEVDSPQSLYVAINLAKLEDSNWFDVYDHTNSARIDHERDAESTSHVFGYFTNVSSPVAENPSTFVFATMLDRKRDATSLGERIFYGVDEFDGTLNHEIDSIPHVRITPTQNETSSLSYIDSNTISITLGNDLIVGGYSNRDQTQLVLLPTYSQDGQQFLLRGELKTTKLHTLLEPLVGKMSYEINENEGTIVITNL